MTRSTIFTCFCTFGFQSENHEKPFLPSSSPGRSRKAKNTATSDQPGMAGQQRSREEGNRRLQAGASRRPVEGEKRECPGHAALSTRGRLRDRNRDRSDLNISTKFRETFSHLSRFFCIFSKFNYTNLFSKN